MSGLTVAGAMAQRCCEPRGGADVCRHSSARHYLHDDAASAAKQRLQQKRERTTPSKLTREKKVDFKPADARFGSKEGVDWIIEAGRGDRESSRVLWPTETRRRRQRQHEVTTYSNNGITICFS